MMKRASLLLLVALTGCSGLRIENPDPRQLGLFDVSCSDSPGCRMRAVRKAQSRCGKANPVPNVETFVRDDRFHAVVDCAW